MEFIFKQFNHIELVGKNLKINNFDESIITQKKRSMLTCALIIQSKFNRQFHFLLDARDQNPPKMYVFAR